MRSQASSEGRRTLTLLGCRARRRLRHDGRVATAVLGRADAHVQPALGLVVTADAGCLSNRFCSVLLCPCMGSIRFRSVSSPAAVLRGRRPRARWARAAASRGRASLYLLLFITSVLGLSLDQCVPTERPALPPASGLSPMRRGAPRLSSVPSQRQSDQHARAVHARVCAYGGKAAAGGTSRVPSASRHVATGAQRRLPPRSPLLTARL